MIAREGWIFILTGLVLTVVLLWVSTRWDSRVAFGASLILAVLTIFTTYFFRDPERTFVPEPGLVVSPADGKVVRIDTIADHPYVGRDALQVSIFLTIFDVHVNRIPVGGEIKDVKYNPGKFFPAYRHKASELNEQTEIKMVAESGQRLAVKQIAGLIARRIVCRLEPGDRVARGDRFGMIRFGSRVDLILPAGSRVAANIGEQVYGGRTAIAYLAESTVSDSTAVERRSDAEL